MSRFALFCSVDALWQQFAPRWQQELLAQGGRRHVRQGRMRPVLRSCRS